MFRKSFFFTFSIFLFFVALFLVSTKPTHAILGVEDITTIVDTIKTIGKPNPINEALYEYCKKRQGDQMNLETWYSGKCPEASAENQNSLLGTGDQVGFSDMIRLDFLEAISGYQNKNTSEIIKEYLEKAVSGELTSNKPSPAINQNGILSEIKKGILFTFSNKPASTDTYISSIKNNLAQKRIIPQSYAADQGVGFSTFGGLITIWKAFRNLAYLVFIFIFVMYGFMMIFRIKIDPKTVISIEAALPKLITTLLVISFSYAIVGFMVDIMYVSLDLIANFFVGTGLIKNTVANATTGTNLYYQNSMIAGGKLGIIPSFLHTTFLQIVGSSSVLQVLLGDSSIGFVSFLSGIVSGAFGFIIAVFIFFAMIFVYLKLFWELLMTYISIVTSLIFSPILLLGNVMPGNDALGSWLRNLTGNLAVYPAAFFFLILSSIFMAQPLAYFIEIIPDAKAIDLIGIINLTGSGNQMGGWPIIYPNMMQAGGASASAILGIIGLGLLLMANKYVKMVQDAFKIKPFPYGDAIKENLLNEKSYGWGYGASGRLLGIGAVSRFLPPTAAEAKKLVP